MTEPYDCENCEHYVRITDGRTAKDRICIFDGECEHLPMTNEEYLKSLDTEQLAGFIIKAMLFYDNAGITVLEAIKNAVEDNEKLGSYFMESVVGWLKQPHNGG